MFFERWMSRLPLPLTDADRDAGCWWELAMRQVEVSRTLVFDDPRRARAFFEALLAGNMDLGRPEHAEIIFGRKVSRKTPGVFSTRLLDRGDQVTVNLSFKHSRVKHYLKEAAPCASRPSSMTRVTWAACAAWSTWTNCRPKRVHATPACWIL